MPDRAAVEQAVRRALAASKKLELADAPADADVFEALDSFGVVELLMSTESEIEGVAGRYVPLGDETVLDASRSPLRRLETWVDYVAGAVAHG